MKLSSLVPPCPRPAGGMSCLALDPLCGNSVPIMPPPRRNGSIIFWTLHMRTFIHSGECGGGRLTEILVNTAPWVCQYLLLSTENGEHPDVTVVAMTTWPSHSFLVRDTSAKILKDSEAESPDTKSR